jgi:hypothetical protein
MNIDSATFGLLGAVIGAVISQVGNLTTRVFDDRKARRELMYKTAFDYWKTAFEAAQVVNNRNVPFEALFLYAIELMEISERKKRSLQHFLDEVTEARVRHDALIKNWKESAGPKVA